MVASIPVDGSALAAFPATYRVELSEAVLLPSVNSSDLQVIRPDTSVVDAGSATVIGGNTLQYDIASRGRG